jgi:hypothetical protein
VLNLSLSTTASTSAGQIGEDKRKGIVMTARRILVAAAATLAFIPALALPASAHNRRTYPAALKLYISAPYQDNGVTVVSLWWTAPAGATSFNLIADENTAIGTEDYTATGLPQYTSSMPFIIQVEGDTTLNSATYQVTDNLGQMSNVVTYS